MTVAHLLKYTPQGFYCSADGCASDVVGWGLDGYATVQDVIAAGLHGFLWTAMQQAGEDGPLEREGLAHCFDAAAAILDDYGIKPSACFVGAKGKARLERAIRRREMRT